MANQFVDYLNSMNNSDSNTTAALAEAQVLSPFFSKIKVGRRLGTYIREKITDGGLHSIILTGHAGDGKTSILANVLTELGMLKPLTPLEKGKVYENNGIRLYAVKDMSELPENEQLDYFRNAVTSPQKNQSSLLISNTGPLLKCFEELIKADSAANGKPFGESERTDLQNKILEQLDKNSPKEITLGDYSVLIINTARIDNVDFAEKALKKIIADELWSDCSSCEKSGKCPVCFNRELIKNNEARIASFITYFYRYLYENDKRMTIRQMLSQISFAFTGGLSCSDITDRTKESAKFDYLFPNLFFGYKGVKPFDKAAQINGIRYANELQLDAIALNDDYEMFVSGDFSEIPSDVRGLVEEQHRLFYLKYKSDPKNLDENSSEDTQNQREKEYRKAIRRCYIVLSLGVNSDSASVFDELFGRVFNNYIKLLDGDASPKPKKEIEKIICSALYMDATDSCANYIDSIPLTVKRNDSVYQRALITIGKLNKGDLTIEIKPLDSPFEDNDKHCLVLKICGKEEFLLSLPLITYFAQIADGSISTNANPSLTHGLSKLKTILQKCVGENRKKNSVEVMLNRTDKPQYIEIAFDPEKNDLYYN